MSDKKPGRGADQFPLRFPDGMREEIKRLADEDGQSMNTKIIELLGFSLEESGTDIEGLYQNIIEQRQEIARLRKQLEISRENRTHILWEILRYANEIPPELTVWADRLLRIEDPTSDWVEDDIEDLAIDKPLLPENKEAVRRRVELARQRYDERMYKIIEEINSRHRVSRKEK
ncbi:hypothetical protein QE369_001209 [Agrobacterium larrymoorei]|uniref:Arc-like DNA binding domain-containing protein n=1 Tax=Agrobacterium larrymoorei TaxID=160699 RepID=A0AAJ2BDL6_9HYPH|nr:Arc family DNA-binding protein [Agrobacterium larrymoorei]MDR6101031.1 hypothetical protein [Agrobacterium larrymoorei]